MNTFPLPSPEHPFSNPEPTCALQAPCGWGCAAPGCPQAQTQPTLCALPTERGGEVPAPHLSGAERTFRTAQQPGQEQRGLRRDPTFCTEGCATTGTAQLLLLRAWLPKAVQHSCLYQPRSSFWELQDRATGYKAAGDEGKEHKGPAPVCCSHSPAGVPLMLPVCRAPHGHILHPNPWLSKTTVIPSITATLFKLLPLPSLHSIPRITLRPQRMPHGTAFSDLAAVMWGQQQTPGHTTTFPDHDLLYQALRFIQLPPTSPTKRRATTKKNKLPPNQCLHRCGGAGKRRRAQPCPGCSGAVPLPALSLSISAQHRGNFIPWQTSKARHVNQARCEQSGLSGVTCSRQGRAGICLAEGTPQLGTLQSMQEQSKDMQIFLLHSLQNTAPCSDS